MTNKIILKDKNGLQDKLNSINIDINFYLQGINSSIHFTPDEWQLISQLLNRIEVRK